MHIVVLLGIVSIPVYFLHRHVERRFDYRPLTLGRVALAILGGVGLITLLVAADQGFPAQTDATVVLVILIAMGLAAIARLFQLHWRGAPLIYAILLTASQVVLALALVFVAVGLWVARSAVAFNRDAQAAQAAGIGRGLDALQQRLRHQDSRHRAGIVDQAQADRVFARDQREGLNPDDRRTYEKARDQG